MKKPEFLSKRLKVVNLHPDPQTIKILTDVSLSEEIPLGYCECAPLNGVSFVIKIYIKEANNQFFDINYGNLENAGKPNSNIGVVWGETDKTFVVVLVENTVGVPAGVRSEADLERFQEVLKADQSTQGS